MTRSALHPILAITEAKTSKRFNAAPQDFLPAFAEHAMKAAFFVALKRKQVQQIIVDVLCAKTHLNFRFCLTRRVIREFGSRQFAPARIAMFQLAI